MAYSLVRVRRPGEAVCEETQHSDVTESVVGSWRDSKITGQRRWPVDGWVGTARAGHPSGERGSWDASLALGRCEAVGPAMAARFGGSGEMVVGFSGRYWMCAEARHPLT